MQRKLSDNQAVIQLKMEADLLSEKCIACGLCQQECAFLQKYGSPKNIAGTYGPASTEDRSMAFECSLCQLCAAVCPVGLNPAALFLEMRRTAASRGTADFSCYHRILNYERRGISRWYSSYALPEGCDTILFPGCALAGTRPARVRQLYEHLLTTIPRLGLVLDCCTKPSHSLGREGYFRSVFSEMRDYLLQHGVRNVLVACPSCYVVFQQYGGGLQVKTVYEHLAANPLPVRARADATVTIHDPCSTRNERHIHEAVRRLVVQSSLSIREMRHHGPETLCCGEGGAVGYINPSLSKGWGEKRRQEAGGARMITYCAGCAQLLGAGVIHILDLLFAPEASLAGRVKVAKPPWTSVNRLFLKRHFQKTIKASISRVRTFTGDLD
ncbi:MAG: (Fe-S)-binding protein [Desulfocapsaceae bacterium]|nr:(Fe-S)-binding protein [Desulfocapsaceae bacterium]